jgi:hypothetical protein
MNAKQLTFLRVQDRCTPSAKIVVSGQTKPAKAGVSAVRGAVLTVTILILSLLSSRAANWYVRPSSAGADNGTDWNNAWDIPALNSNWSKVSPGDTVWLAGGTYTSSIQFAANGASGNPINVKRVLSSDAVPVAAAGWNSSFDSQVQISPANANPLNWTGSGNFVSVDGRIRGGIQTNLANVSFFTPGSVSISGSHDITVSNVDIAGPGSGTIFNTNAYALALGTGSNIMVTRCLIHGTPNLLNLSDVTNVTIDHCTLYDNGAANPETYHPNVADTNSGTSNFVFRYNDLSGWPVEGFMLWNGVGSMYFYGNIIHDVGAGSPSFIWPSGTGESTAGPIYLYNNTFVNVPMTTGQENQVAFASGSQARNNIYWNSSWTGSTISDSDYSFSDSSAAGSHSISHGSNPFVNLTGKDYHIISTVGPSLPAGKGVALASTYATDPDGNIRGAGGAAWDIGAYVAGMSAPAAPQNLRIIP